MMQNLIEWKEKLSGFKWHWQEINNGFRPLMDNVCYKDQWKKKKIRVNWWRICFVEYLQYWCMFVKASSNGSEKRKFSARTETLRNCEKCTLSNVGIGSKLSNQVLDKQLRIRVWLFWYIMGNVHYVQYCTFPHIYIMYVS